MSWTRSCRPAKCENGDEYERGFVPYLFGNSWTWLYGFLNNAPSISEDKASSQ
ncbi:MAG: hypothetical protein R2911_19980 [Caldilineaceae bacterium]